MLYTPCNSYECQVLRHKIWHDGVCVSEAITAPRSWQFHFDLPNIWTFRECKPTSHRKSELYSKALPHLLTLMQCWTLQTCAWRFQSQTHTDFRSLVKQITETDFFSMAPMLYTRDWEFCKKPLFYSPEAHATSCLHYVELNLTQFLLLWVLRTCATRSGDYNRH
jgi:hypothetical protein